MPFRTKHVSHFGCTSTVHSHSLGFMGNQHHNGTPADISGFSSCVLIPLSANINSVRKGDFPLSYGRHTASPRTDKKNNGFHIDDIHPPIHHSPHHAETTRAQALRHIQVHSHSLGFMGNQHHNGIPADISGFSSCVLIPRSANINLVRKCIFSSFLR